MTQEVKLRRVQSNFQAENARFLLECDFSKQYNQYYLKRLEKTRPFLEFNCRSKWGSDIPIYTLAEVAAFSLTGSDEDEERIDDNGSDLGSSSFLNSSVVSSPLSGNYKFAKRIRKTSTNKPMTSTQNEQPEEAGLCIVIGTIFKRMRLQPDVVEELSRGDFHVKFERYLGHYTSPDDTLVLQDADESILLVGNINPKRYVTGVVVALLGVSIDDGSQFLVRDVCFAEPNRQLLYHELSQRQPLDLEDGQAKKGPVYLMVLSGLGFHHHMDKANNLTRALQNMIDFIWGGAKYTDDERSSRVTRILVVGDCLSPDRLTQGDDTSIATPDEIAVKMKKSRQVKPYSESICAVNHMDDFFAQLSKTIDIDVMPGPSDPSSHLMPQQPFHPCMFPKSCMFSTFNCTTNPHHAIYNDNVEILATSGQNIDIISKFSSLQDPLEVMKCHLRWANCAPSAPDNLYSAPYEDEDPYVIDFIPEIYIAGCQNSFKTDWHYYNDWPSKSDVDTTDIAGESGTPTSLHQTSIDSSLLASPTTSTTTTNNNKSRTLLVTIPRFCETFSCVLIDLTSLEAQLLSF